jgi:hypothetical protein
MPLPLQIDGTLMRLTLRHLFGRIAFTAGDCFVVDRNLGPGYPKMGPDL